MKTIIRESSGGKKKINVILIITFLLILTIGSFTLFIRAFAEEMPAKEELRKTEEGNMKKEYDQKIRKNTDTGIEEKKKDGNDKSEISECGKKGEYVSSENSSHNIKRKISQTKKWECKSASVIFREDGTFSFKINKNMGTISDSYKNKKSNDTEVTKGKYEIFDDKQVNEDPEGKAVIYIEDGEGGYLTPMFSSSMCMVNGKLNMHIYLRNGKEVELLLEEKN